MPPRTRIELFDNIKGVLIVLVVIGHFMHPVHNDNPAISAGFDIIYLFHMPLFVFMSGLFAKGAYRDGHLNVNRIISYLVLGIAYQAAIILINGSELLPKLFQFTSAPWYLIAMAWWYAATPLLARMRPAMGIGISCAIALAWGAVDLSDGLLAISRTLTFLPWFACGYYLKPERVAQLHGNRWLWAAVPVAAAIALARLLDPTVYDWFFQRVYGDTPYLAGICIGLVEKTVATAIAVVFSLAVIKLIPSETRPCLGLLGRRSLQIYVIHRLIRAALTFRTPFYDLPILLDPLWGTLIVLAISAAVCGICAALPVEQAFNSFMRRAWIARPAETDR
ncbi:acyltransferase family protein [Collinsella tanakaei]|uniref:acyltransferase family protein n=1 Tax=Collinsella tanakaei TaxID=626935 RepID=UPI0025A4914A|nr:acyltransferase family protein [Collinsella tanakaei]MDM8300171.1 acyltransferase family protein [Collinsella tanakaei]